MNNNTAREEWDQLVRERRKKLEAIGAVYDPDSGRHFTNLVQLTDEEFLVRIKGKPCRAHKGAWMSMRTYLESGHHQWVKLGDASAEEVARLDGISEEISKIEVEYAEKLSAVKAATDKLNQDPRVIWDISIPYNP